MPTSWRLKKLSEITPGPLHGAPGHPWYRKRTADKEGGTHIHLHLDPLQTQGRSFHSLLRRQHQQRSLPLASRSPQCLCWNSEQQLSPAPALACLSGRTPTARFPQTSPSPSPSGCRQPWRLPCPEVPGTRKGVNLVDMTVGQHREGTT